MNISKVKRFFWPMDALGAERIGEDAKTQNDAASVEVRLELPRPA